jgi:hypothetical protein
MISRSDVRCTHTSGEDQILLARAAASVGRQTPTFREMLPHIKGLSCARQVYCEVFLFVNSSVAREVSKTTKFDDSSIRVRGPERVRIFSTAARPNLRLTSLTSQWALGTTGMTLTGVNQSTRRKTCPSATLLLVNPTSTGPTGIERSPPL